MKSLSLVTIPFSNAFSEEQATAEIRNMDKTKEVKIYVNQNKILEYNNGNCFLCCEKNPQTI